MKYDKLHQAVSCGINTIKFAFKHLSRYRGNGCDDKMMKTIADSLERGLQMVPLPEIVFNPCFVKWDLSTLNATESNLNQLRSFLERTKQKVQPFPYIHLEQFLFFAPPRSR